MEGRKACLRIEIDRQDTIPMQGEVLGKVRGCRGLAASALEIDDRNDLEMLVAAPVGHITTACPTIFIEKATQFPDLLRSIGAPARGGDFGSRAFAFKRQVAQVAGLHAEELGGFTQLE